MRDDRLFHSVAHASLFAASLWAVQATGQLFGLPLALLAVHAGAVSGLHGILTAPLVHGSYGHLMANTAALVVLGAAMLYGSPRASKAALPMIWLGSGFGCSRARPPISGRAASPTA